MEEEEVSHMTLHHSHMTNYYAILQESGEDEGELKPEDLQAGLITPLEGG